MMLLLSNLGGNVKLVPNLVSLLVKSSGKVWKRYRESLEKVSKGLSRGERCQGRYK